MRKICFTMMACAALCACTSDDIALNGAGGGAEDGVYMKFSITMASTRSATESDADNDGDYVKSEDGEEYGQDWENAVESVSILLVDGASQTTYARADLTDLDLVGTDTYVVCFEDTQIKKAAEKAVDVYVYCNQTVSAFAKDATYALTSASDGTPWTSGAFLMSNAVRHSVVIPSEAALSAYNSKANPLDLGAVRVERSVARFDYKDGAVQANGAYTYPLWRDDQGGILANAVVSAAALVNMSGEFYTLRHMANSGDDQSVADLTLVDLLSTEYANNWVIDTDADAKLAGTAKGFLYSMEEASAWQFDDLSLLDNADNNDTWDTGSEQNYKIWRYATENTIPSVAAQTHGNTTGIVFKTELVDVSSANLFDGESRVYVYENTGYKNWAAVKEAAEAAGESSSLYDAYREVMDVWNAELELDASAGEYNEKVTAQMAKAGFTGYSPDADGRYYMYYYYWNRHNDNGDPNVMGVMEYAVVRNNVYKLSVTDITGFGHPLPGTNDPDPDPESPDDPDEQEEIWIKVDVEILPWVVRLNDIKF